MTFRVASAASLVAALWAIASAQAADVALKAPVAPPGPKVDWSGFYLGAQAGQAFSVIESEAFTDTLPVAFQSYSCTGGFCDGRRDAAIGGITLGYNHQYEGGSLLGIEADLSYSGLDGNLTYSGVVPVDPFQRVVGSGTGRLHTPFIGTLRLRAGYAIDRLLPYVTAGLAVTYSTSEVSGTNVLQAQVAPGVWAPLGGEPLTIHESAWTAGWTAGGGAEYALSDQWSAKVDYLYIDLITSDLGEDPPKMHQWRAGINYRF